MATESFLTMGDLERETGISRDTLRVWERRYGFPLPQRTPAGERRYPAEQLERLLLIRQLLDAGLRPGKIMAHNTLELRELSRQSAASSPFSTTIEQLITHLQRQSGNDLRNQLEALAHQHGLRSFLTTIVAPLNHAVGQAWAEGRIGVLEEHRYVEELRTLLSAAMQTIPCRQTGFRALLTTLPGEQHGIGLLMTACMLALEGVEALQLGVQTPLEEIRRGALENNCHIVGISCSGYPQRRATASQLVRLRAMLPRETALWVGGAGAGRLTALPNGIRLFHDLQQLPAALLDLRSHNAKEPSSSHKTC